WLYEISHKNPIWMHPNDGERLGVETGDAVRIDTEIGWFVNTVWLAEAIKPGIVAVSHHLGRWRVRDGEGVGAGMSNVVTLEESADGGRTMRVTRQAEAHKTFDPDTERIWWKDVGVHQNMTHAVHPDPISGAHCWLQKAPNVRKATADEKPGDVYVDTKRSMQVYEEWKKLARPAAKVSPDGNRRPYWLARPLKPTEASYKLKKR
ncbi:MAG: formate dehydrogenase, partial [Gemmatimonadetes bacterium]|nr:formate dehydrogenase [Gemmatimonadota bacterium]